MFLSFKELKPLHFVLYSLVQLAGAFFGAAVAFLVYCGQLSIDLIKIDQIPSTLDLITLPFSFPRCHQQIRRGHSPSLRHQRHRPNLRFLRGPPLGCAQRIHRSGPIIDHYRSIPYPSLLLQVVATAVFCLAIAHITDKRNNYPSYLQPFLVGTSFVMVGTAFAYNAGCALSDQINHFDHSDHFPSQLPVQPGPRLWTPPVHPAGRIRMGSVLVSGG